MSFGIKCLEENAREKIEILSFLFLEKIMKYQSYPHENNEDITELLTFVLHYCQERGFKTKNIDNLVGWAEVGTGKNLIAFPVHLDVVPPGTGWETPPFELTIIEETMYGRGVSDNKASVAILVHILDYINQTVNLENNRLRLIFGTNEETGMKCIRKYLETEETPINGFVPDAMYPLVNGEKGRLHIELSTKLPSEITDRIKINGGEQVNSVAESCQLTILKKILVDGDNRLNDSSVTHYFSGVSAHAASPEKGQSAIIKCLEFINERYSILAIKELLQPFYLPQNRQSASGVINNLGETTCNIGVIRQREERVYVELDIRYGQDITKENLLELLKNQLTQWEVNLLDSKPLHYVEPNNPTVKILLQVYQYHTQEKNAKPTTMGGGTYASYFENLVAFGPKFPKVRTYAHSSNERMSISIYRKNIQLYFSAIHCLMEEKE